MRKLFFLIACFVAAAALNACNTMQGIGKDLKKGGETIEKSAK